MATAETILSNYDPEVSTIGFQVRTFLKQQLKDIIEYPDVSARIIGYGYGSGYKQTICTIIPSKTGIKLGFYKGSELPDPEKLLTGTGKVHKHVVIKSSSDLKSTALKNLLTEALKAYQERNPGKE